MSLLLLMVVVSCWVAKRRRVVSLATALDTHLFFGSPVGGNKRPAVQDRYVGWYGGRLGMSAQSRHELPPTKKSSLFALGQRNYKTALEPPHRTHFFVYTCIECTVSMTVGKRAIELRLTKRVIQPLPPKQILPRGKRIHSNHQQPLYTIPPTLLPFVH